MMPRGLVIVMLAACTTSSPNMNVPFPPDGPPQFTCSSNGEDICNAAMVIGWQECERRTRCGPAFPAGEDVQGCAVAYVATVCTVFDCSMTEADMNAVITCADQLGNAPCGQQVTCTP